MGVYSHKISEYFRHSKLKKNNSSVLQISDSQYDNSLLRPYVDVYKNPAIWTAKEYVRMLMNLQHYEQIDNLYTMYIFWKVYK